MAGALLGGRVDAVIVGADRIAATATSRTRSAPTALAVLAHHHGIPFYVAAPVSTFDPDTPDGASIPVELRGGDEVAVLAGRRLAPAGAAVENRAFDVTPAALVTAYVTEEGVRRP